MEDASGVYVDNTPPPLPIRRGTNRSNISLISHNTIDDESTGDCTQPGTSSWLYLPFILQSTSVDLVT